MTYLLDQSRSTSAKAGLVLPRFLLSILAGVLGFLCFNRSRRDSMCPCSNFACATWAATCSAWSRCLHTSAMSAASTILQRAMGPISDVWALKCNISVRRAMTSGSGWAISICFATYSMAAKASVLCGSPCKAHSSSDSCCCLAERRALPFHGSARRTRLSTRASPRARSASLHCSGVAKVTFAAPDCRSWLS